MKYVPRFQQYQFAEIKKIPISASGSKAHFTWLSYWMQLKIMKECMDFFEFMRATLQQVGRERKPELKACRTYGEFHKASFFFSFFFFPSGLYTMQYRHLNCTLSTDLNKDLQDNFFLDCVKRGPLWNRESMKNIF